MIFLRFTTSKSWISRAIRLATWSEWSHVEIAVPARGYLGAHLDGGVLLRPFEYDNTSEFVFGQVDCSPEVEKKVYDFAFAQIGKKYDLTGCIGLEIHRDWHKADTWFCSELVAAAFEYASYPLVNPREHDDRVTPNDIWYSVRVDNVPPGAVRPSPGLPK